jgi:hypothetical protein
MESVQVKITPFSGEKKDWERWSTTFLAKARLRGYRNLIIGVEIPPNKGSKDYENYVLKNDVAYAEILIACECEICFGIINSSRSETLPDGDAKLAWDNLIAKFEPRTKSSLIQLKKQFLDNKLRDLNQDPDQWIQSLESMQRKLQILGHKISEMDMIIHILQNLTKEYDTTVEILENDLDNDLISLDRVKERLRARFEKIQRTKTDQDGALMIKDMRPGKYKGLYSFCGMYGHKAAQSETN